MEEDCPVDFVVVVLDDESIGAVKQTVRADVAVELLENAKALSDVHAGFSDDLWVLFEGVPADLHLFAALIVEHHFESPVLPVSSHQEEVLARLEQACEGDAPGLLVLPCDPTVSIAAISGHQHESRPHVIIAVVSVVLLVLLNQTQSARACPFFYSQLSQGHCSLTLLYYASLRKITLFHTENLHSLE
jgi:hypothetical protein